jgi:hypothetical protein
VTQVEARAAIKRAAAEAILGLPDDLRAEAISNGGAFRFEVHIATAQTVDAVERPAMKKNVRRSRKR